MKRADLFPYSDCQEHEVSYTGIYEGFTSVIHGRYLMKVSWHQVISLDPGVQRRIAEFHEEACHNLIMDKVEELLCSAQNR